MATLTLEKLSKVYRQKGKADTPAVRAVDMAVGDGEIISLLGSSGCGKTSTLRMIAGLESVSDGAIRIGPRRVDALKPAERNVAMAFEGYALYPPLTVADNIGFSLLRGKASRADVRARVRQVAELLEITDILDAYPPTLSGGQQQRVSLARALVRDADLYLFDEPMSQLEPHLRSVLRGRIKDYLIHRRMTAVFVTHDQTEAVALSDRIAVMSDGVLQQFASPADLKARPANLFVAGFIGEPAMNLLPARVVLRHGRVDAVVAGSGDSEALRVSFGDASRVANVVALRDGQTVHLGIRPHEVMLSVPPGARAQPVQGTLVFNQWQGDQSHLGVDLGGHTLLVVTDGEVAVATGAPLALGLPPAALHLFDSASGQALLHGADAA